MSLSPQIRRTCFSLAIRVQATARGSEGFWSRLPYQRNEFSAITGIEITPLAESVTHSEKPQLPHCFVAHMFSTHHRNQTAVPVLLRDLSTLPTLQLALLMRQTNKEGTSPMTNDSNVPQPRFEHFHVCVQCGGAFRREEFGARSITSGIYTCPKCGHQGPLNVQIREVEGHAKDMNNPSAADSSK